MEILDYYGVVWSTCVIEYNTGIEFVLYEPDQDQKTTKAPVRLRAYGGLADYIKDMVSSKMIEKYVRAHWYYDENTILHKIEYYAPESNALAKAITAVSPRSDGCIIFGHQELLETKKPAPMDEKEMKAYKEFEDDPTKHRNILIQRYATKTNRPWRFY